MFRIDNPTAAAALPTPAAPGTAGYFTGGNPATATPATILDPDWLNAVQEELFAILTAASLAGSKTNRGQVLAALDSLFATPGAVATSVAAVAHGRLLNIQLFGTPGVQTYTPTPGTVSAKITVIGAGGGGAGTPATGAGQVAVGGPGGAGSVGVSLLTISGSVAVTIGAQGAAGGPGANGGWGGTSSFGTFISAPGGPGGTTTAAGISAIVIPGYGSPSVGGNRLNLYGSVGTVGQASVAGGFVFSGNGGDSMFGAGAPGSAAPSPGASATGYGAGGSGAAAGISVGALSGGWGAPGLVIVEDYS